VISTNTIAQENNRPDVNLLFELKADTIERRITVNKWGNDTSYFLHYTVKNISTDTLSYMANSCFYYNHYTLKIGQIVFDLNPTGGCKFNSVTIHELSPGESFHMADWITAVNLKLMKTGIEDAVLSIPLVMDNKAEYRVDGRSFVENKEYLVFKGPVKIIETYFDKRKRKRNKNY